MPDGDFGRQVAKDSPGIRLNVKEPALAFGTGVSFARLQPSHKPDWGAERQSHLLVTATDAEDWLFCFFDYREDSGQRFRGISFPGMTLAAEDDVRGSQRLNPLERNFSKGFR